MNDLIWNLHHLALTAVFRSGPRNLRPSTGFLVLGVLLFLLVDATLLNHTSNASWLAMLSLSAIKVLVAGMFIWYWLNWNKVSERFQATAIALLVLGAVAQLLKIPFLPATADHLPWMIIPPVIVLLWSFAVFLFILKQAANKPYMEIFLLLILINIVSYTLATTAIVAVTGKPITVRTISGR